MAKKVQAMVKLQIAAGKATPAPPVGTALGPQGVNIMDFCKNFNARTAKDEGLIIPVVVTVYADRSLHLHHQDAAGAGAAEARGEHREGLGRAEQEQGRHGDGEAGRGDRQAEDARPELPTRSKRRSRRSRARRGRWGSTSSDRQQLLNARSAECQRILKFATLRFNSTWESRASARLHHRRYDMRKARQEIHGRPRAGRRRSDLHDRRGDPARAEGQVREVRRDRRAVAAARRRSRSTPIRWCAAPSSCRTASARASACWRSPAARSRRKRRKPAPTSSAARRWSRRSRAAGWTSTPSSRRPT